LEASLRQHATFVRSLNLFLMGFVKFLPIRNVYWPC